MTQVRLRLEPAQAGFVVVQLVGSGGVPAGGLDLAGKGVLLGLAVPATQLAADGTLTVELLPTAQVTPAGTVYRAVMAGVAPGGAEASLMFTVPASTGVTVDATDYIAAAPTALGPLPTIDDGGAALATAGTITDGGTA